MNKRLYNILFLVALFLVAAATVKADAYNTSDNTAPNITITLPVANVYTGSSVFINVTLNGTGTNISQALFYINNSLVGNYTYNSSNTSNCTYMSNWLFNCYFSTPMADGFYNFTITTYDFGNNSGNIFTTSENFGVDTLVPNITMVSPSSNNSIINNMTINFSVSDANINLTTVNITGYSNSSLSNLTSFFANGLVTVSSGFSEGIYNITIVSYDFAGKITTVIFRNITYDQLPTGSLTSLSPISGTYVVGTTTNYSVNGLANDTFSGIRNVTILVNGTANGTATWNSSSTLWNYTLNNLAPGMYNVTARIFDNNTNILKISALLVVDNISPNLVVVTPAINGVYPSLAGSMLQLNFTPSDNSGSLSSCWYNLTGPVSATNVSIGNCTNGAISSTQLYLANGTYNISISANDSFNNIGTYTTVFNVSDTTGPVASNFQAPSNPSVNTYAQINFTTDESATCYWASGPSLINTPMTDNILSHTFNAIANAGSNTVYVTCKDLSNNYGGNYSTPFTGVTPNSGGGSPGGGGGGGGGSSTPDPSGSATADLKVGDTAIGITATGVPVSNIILTSLSVMSNVKFTVTATSYPAATYSGTVYKYVQVDHPAIDNSLISDAKITFQIEKTWFTANNKNKADIVLLRYVTSWTPLTTTIINEDGTYVYYLADSPGLSLFSIATLANASNTTSKTNNTATNNSINVTKANTNTNTTTNNISFYFKVGDIVTQIINGVSYTLKIINVSTDGTNVVVSVNNVTDSISAGQSKVIDGLNVYAQSVSPRNNTVNGSATLQFSKSVATNSAPANPYTWLWTSIIFVAIVGIIIFIVSKRNKDEPPGPERSPPPEYTGNSPQHYDHSG